MPKVCYNFFIYKKGLLLYQLWYNVVINKKLEYKQMTNNSQFVQVKSSINDLFRRIDNQPSSVHGEINEKMNGKMAEIAKVTEQINAELDNYFKELDAIKTEQLNTRITKLDEFCKAHKGTSFDILKPYTVNVFVCGETYSIDVFDDDSLDSKLQKIGDLLKISKQLDECGVNHRLKKSYYPFGGVDEIRLILDKFGHVVVDFTIENDDTIKLKAEYVSDSLEYIKRQIDPFTTFEVEVGTRDHEEFYITITSTNHCKLEDVAIKMQQLAEHISDNIDFQAK